MTTNRTSPRPTTLTTRTMVVALVVGLAALLGGGFWLSRSLEDLPGSDAVRRATSGIDEQDGYVGRKPLSPFAEDHPAIANLDPSLRIAVQDAARAAADDGIDLLVTSGWRSARYQQSLLDKAVDRYGSRAEAARFVLSPERSQHVTGRAVDIGHAIATTWLQQHGAAYGLCQTYANERWHFELAVTAGDACPPPRADASDVPGSHASDEMMAPGHMVDVTGAT